MIRFQSHQQGYSELMLRTIMPTVIPGHREPARSADGGATERTLLPDADEEGRFLGRDFMGVTVNEDDLGPAVEERKQCVPFV